MLQSRSILLGLRCRRVITFTEIFGGVCCAYRLIPYVSQKNYKNFDFGSMDSFDLRVLKRDITFNSVHMTKDFYPEI